ncbi:hypothetical protein K504DRAFT_457583 [Pleomassaria siparia CBS 279.74]|uniref:P-loop containing nucleoside triphosphate hydrolase protein n=1 Tax=Pleomassaria siparia CBS 279.74 TaxID=1314801 RepID=A0A6G1KR97_9PLEO|nr:hypothetical protein K504DRAFT_457583 [Pleomassaria siparia CBS 279.74]
MSNKPIFVATHPRACSTAFERVFMTRRDTLTCFHEPFGDPYYFGPERLAERYMDDAKARKESGYADCTYKAVFDMMAKGGSENKRSVIKDMAQYWIPPSGKPATIAPSLSNYKRGVGTDTTALSPVQSRFPKDGYPYDTKSEPGNPTIVPAELLKNFHFAFLIRHPRNSIPSYYRCTIPPLDEMTGFYNFRPDEAGYDELRRLFDYLRAEGQVGPKIAGQGSETSSNGVNGHSSDVEICVIDADDLLDNPSGIMEAFCKSTGVDYEPEMLVWDNEEDHRIAKEAFEKWKGFHEDAIKSTELKARTHKKTPKSDSELLEEWTTKYGAEGAKQIADTVKECEADYEYLKKFAIKVPSAV